MITFSIIGLGNRGSVYADNLIKEKDVKIVAVCDVLKESLTQAKELYGVDDSNLFTDEEEFFKQKRADVLIVSTLDGLHTRQAIKGMSIGYDILLEKPMAPSLEDCVEIKKASEKYGRDVVICHNLRYTPFYQKIKTIISNGEIGDVVSVEQSENVAYHHYMCSFIRGKWHKREETSSIILQKCCHDLDIITWFVGNVDDTLQSFGNLVYYTKDNAPKDSNEYCVNCNIKDCIYNAYEFYCKAPECLCVPYGFDKSNENIKNYLSDKNNNYAKCVFRSQNNVCDRQTVSISYVNGVTASLLMHGFANTTDRITVVFGTKGIVYGDFNEGIVHLDLFDGNTYSYDVNKQISGDSHNGGDSKLVGDYVVYKQTATRPLGISKVGDSVKSHELAFEAERVRDNNAKLEKVTSIENDYIVSDSGVYSTSRSFIEQGKLGKLQIIAFSVNDNEEKIKEKISNDLAYALSITKSNLLDYSVNISNDKYKHGFIDIYLESGILIRYALTCAPYQVFTKIRYYGTNGTIYADTISNSVIKQSATLFDKEVKLEVVGDNYCKVNNYPEIVKEIIEKI